MKELRVRFTLWILRIICLAPISVSLRLGRLFGRALFIFARHRRMVCEKNIRVCFPNLSTQQRKDLVLRCFEENGVGLIETGWAWNRRPSFFESKLVSVGEDKVKQLLANNTGILLLCPHYSMLDIVAPLLHQVVSKFVISYRPNENQALDQAICDGRARYGTLVNVRSVRAMVNHLKSGELVWFGPDQDMGPKGSVFAPFFGNPACTVTTPSRLAKMSGCETFFLKLHREAGVYYMNFVPMPSGYPFSDEVRNATELNNLIESALSKYPEQYMWMHRRFKTNPDRTRHTFY